MRYIDEYKPILSGLRDGLWMPGQLPTEKMPALLRYLVCKVILMRSHTVSNDKSKNITFLCVENLSARISEIPRCHAGLRTKPML